MPLVLMHPQLPKHEIFTTIMTSNSDSPRIFGGCEATRRFMEALTQEDLEGDFPDYQRPRVSEQIILYSRSKAAIKRRLVGTRKSQTTVENIEFGAKRYMGQLAYFHVVLPLELIYKILEYLSPASLLHLSHVSKPWNELLRTKRPWVVARNNISGLPDCPSDLNEAQYASLLFGITCQACGLTHLEPDSYVVYLGARIRTCGLCAEQIVVDKSRVGGYSTEFMD